MRYTLGVRTNYTRQSLEQRFWPKVDKNGPCVRPELGACWDWTATVLSQQRPYGVLQQVPASSLGPAVKSWRAHVLSWIIHNGPIPDPALCVCHRCDRPQCVNPSHLFLATRAANNRDRTLKQRNGDFRGDRNPNAKLTPDQVVEIRERFRRGERQTALAREFGVAQPHVSRLVRGTAYTGNKLSREEQRRLG